MEKVVIEVGSTCTKVDGFDGENIIHIDTVAIEFKKHYLEHNAIIEEDIEEIISLVKKYKNKYSKDIIFVCGTSVFRTMKELEKENFLTRFKNETELKFNIITQEDENILTVRGATKNVKEAVVFVGGGASTEISYFNNEIKEMKNNKFGVMDVIKVFPDLAEDIASTSLETIMKYIEERIEVPNIKTDILILAGGGHEYFAKTSGIRYNKNELFADKYEDIMMSIEERVEDTNRYYTQISLDEIRSRVDEPKWWYCTRAMCAFVLVVAKKIGAKYIVPTDISMIHGII